MKVSVIVPVYKVEKYINACIESIVNQTYKDLEIVLVDDGSPDNCPKICDEWEKKDERIKVIHKENTGVSDSRNKALDLITGDYVCFVDGDDTIHDKYVETLLNTAIENGADVAACNWKKVYDIENPQNKDFHRKELKSTVFENDEVFDLIYNKKVPLIMALWTKIYKKEIFSELRFPLYAVAEDDAVLPYVLNNCKKFVYIDCVLYNNTQRQDSVTATKFSIKKLKALEVFKNRIQFIERNKPDFKTKAINHYIRILILYYHYVKWAKMSDEILMKIKAEIDLFVNDGYSSKLTKMFYKFPKLLNLILKIRQKII